MASIDLKRSHTMETGELREAVDELLVSFQGEYPGLISNVEWNGAGTEAKAKGKGFKASFSLSSSDLAVSVELSMLARAFKGKVQSGLEKKMDEILGSS